ncbi:hypothetical protein GYMLUDRAFT_252605 [Collybiopsis luxurians FD-317 M1]|uniref:Uncharacterized protein n=1 Tax=Collybiopsis luxurians FD-317 M1 TaxID=944289 RepID=A0A0D0C7T5_9AGAR|nr:hypothetical protein GYMLUDRAFT_252605 [Collybiopsis luxurians FD-317 M1]
MVSSKKETKHSRYYAKWAFQRLLLVSTALPLVQFRHQLERQAQSQEYRLKCAAASKQHESLRMDPSSLNQPQPMSSQATTKHSRYYAKHRSERQAQSREYKHRRTTASKRRETPRVAPHFLDRPQLLFPRAEGHIVSMYREFHALRNSIDDWWNRAVPQFPAMKPELIPQFSTLLHSGGALSNEVHVFLDHYIDHLSAFDDLDLWRFFKGICAMQQALRSGRARLVFEMAPHMEIPQPTWGSSTLWVLQDLRNSTNIIYRRLLKLRTRTDRLTKITKKMQRYDGELIWRYEEVEKCIHSGWDLGMDWYTMLDDLEEDPPATDLLMFIKEVSHTLYELGQTLEYLTYVLRKLPRK